MKKVMPLILSGIAIGAIAGMFLKNSEPAFTDLQRRPSSEALSGKHQRLFEVLIKPSSSMPSSDNKDLELEASITLLQPQKGEVHFQWVLPEGAQIVEGEVSDSVANLLAGQVLTRKLVVQGVSQEGINKIVSLQVWMDVDGVKMGGAGVFATHAEELQISGSSASNKLQSEEHPLPKSLQQ
jgi:hypothetical protein